MLRYKNMFKMFWKLLISLWYKIKKKKKHKKPETLKARKAPPKESFIMTTSWLIGKFLYFTLVKFSLRYTYYFSSGRYKRQGIKRTNRKIKLLTSTLKSLLLHVRLYLASSLWLHRDKFRQADNREIVRGESQ